MRVIFTETVLAGLSHEALMRLHSVLLDALASPELSDADRIRINAALATIDRLLKQRDWMANPPAKSPMPSP
ncbi:MAG: hypothetical protein AAFR75_02890 [Pseudomonadota bacterium]